MLKQLLWRETRRFVLVLLPALLLAVATGYGLRANGADEITIVPLISVAFMLLLPLYTAFCIRSCRAYQQLAQPPVIQSWLVAIISAFAFSAVLSTGPTALFNALFATGESQYVYDDPATCILFLCAFIGATLARRFLLSLVLAVIVGIGSYVVLMTCLVNLAEDIDTATWSLLLCLLPLTYAFYLRTALSPERYACWRRLLLALAGKNLRLLFPAFAAFVLLAALLLYFLQSGGSDHDGIAGYLGVGRLLALGFAVVAANLLVAGERASRTLAQLQTLPLTPAALWRHTFLAGLLVVFAFHLLLTFAVPAPGSEPVDLYSPYSGAQPFSRFFGNYLLIISGVELPLLFCVYAVAFLAACFATGPLHGMLLSLVLPLCAGAVILLPFLLLADQIALVVHYGPFNVLESFYALLPALLAAAGAVAALLALQHFRTMHAPRSYVRSIVRYAGFALLLLPPLWLLLLLIVNLPLWDRLPMPYDTSRWYDDARAAQFAGMCARNDALREAFYARFPDSDQALAGEHDDRIGDPLPPAIRNIVAATAAEREAAFRYFRQRDLRPTLFTDGRKTDHSQPRLIWLAGAFRLEQYAILDACDRGDTADALQRLARLTELGEQLLGAQPLLATMIGNSCLQIAVQTGDALYERQPMLLTRQQAAAHALMAGRVEQRLPAQIIEALHLEGIRTGEEAFSFSQELPLYCYPLASPSRLRRLYAGQYAAVAELMQQPFPEAYARDTLKLRWQLSLVRELLLSPMNAVLVSGVPNEPITTLRQPLLTPQLLSIMHAALLRQYALLYERETGTEPATTADLYRHFRCRPLPNPFTGEEFDLLELRGLTTDELDEFAGREQLDALDRRLDAARH